MTIRPYRESDCVLQITELLHAAYAPLAAMGLRYLATHQGSDTTRKRLSSGQSVLALDEGGEILGTITLYPPDPDSPCAWYRRPGHYYFGQFAVAPDRQGEGIGTRLMAEVERSAREAGGSELALDTSDRATRLIDWYSRLGFRLVGTADWEVTNYASVILSKSLGDRPIAEDFPHD